VTVIDKGTIAAGSGTASTRCRLRLEPEVSEGVPFLVDSGERATARCHRVRRWS